MESDSYRIGDEVEALFKGGTKWFKGKIAEVGSRGRYAIRYADGDFEDNVPSTNIRKIGGGDEPRAGAARIPVSPSPSLVSDPRSLSSSPLLCVNASLHFVPLTPPPFISRRFICSQRNPSILSQRL